MKKLKLASVAIAIAGVMLNGTPARAASPEATQLAHQILDLTHASAMADQMLSQMTQGLAGDLNQANPGRQADVQALINQVVTPEFRQAVPGLMEQNAKAYADNFSVDELKQIVAFYQTDLGRKMADKQPALAKAQAEIDDRFGQQFFQRVGPKLDQALAARRLRSPQGGGQPGGN
ncbi:MAG TPA: DUF2059 domain-containing protein [Alphaproteobacteria bacterium]|nr:DUF2059 domain-containing protein [Alphaproteobacteria bacterium]